MTDVITSFLPQHWVAVSPCFCFLFCEDLLFPTYFKSLWIEKQRQKYTVYVVIFGVVLFSRNSRVCPCKNFHFNISIYSNENITKIVKLSPRKFPHLVQITWHIQWEHCGVVVRALDSRVRGSGFESRSVRTPLDKAFCPQLSLSTQV